MTLEKGNERNRQQGWGALSIEGKGVAEKIGRKATRRSTRPGRKMPRGELILKARGGDWGWQD